MLAQDAEEAPSAATGRSLEQRGGEDDRIAHPLEHEPHLAVDLARQHDLAHFDPDRGKERTKRFGTPDTVDERHDRILLGGRETRAEHRDEIVDVRFGRPIASESTELVVTGYKQGAHAVECGNCDPADGKLDPPLPELLEYHCRGGVEAGQNIVDVDRADQCRMHEPKEDQRQESPGVPGRGERPAGSLESQHEVELVDGLHDHDRRRRDPRRDETQLGEDGATGGEGTDTVLLAELPDEPGDTQLVAAETRLVGRACRRAGPPRCRIRLHDTPSCSPY